MERRYGTGLIRSLAEGHGEGVQSHARTFLWREVDGSWLRPELARGAYRRSTLDGVERCGFRRRPWRHGGQPRVYWTQAAGFGWRHSLPVSWRRSAFGRDLYVLISTNGGRVCRPYALATSHGGRQKPPDFGLEVDVARSGSFLATRARARTDESFAGCSPSAAADGCPVPMCTDSTRWRPLHRSVDTFSDLGPWRSMP